MLFAILVYRSGQHRLSLVRPAGLAQRPRCDEQEATGDAQAWPAPLGRRNEAKTWASVRRYPVLARTTGTAARPGNHAVRARAYTVPIVGT